MENIIKVFFFFSYMSGLLIYEWSSGKRLIPMFIHIFSLLFNSRSVTPVMEN